MSNTNNMLHNGGMINKLLDNKTIFEYVKSNWIYLFAIVFFIIIGVLIIYYFLKNKHKTLTYSANNEHTNADTTSNKTAKLLLFYVDWCPHCKTAVPEWESLKDEYEGKQINGYTVTFVEYNCTDESPEVNKLMDEYNIEGYPTIKLVKDNQVIEYNAKPSKSTIIQFLNTVL